MDSINFHHLFITIYQQSLAGFDLKLATITFPGNRCITGPLTNFASFHWFLLVISVVSLKCQLVLMSFL